VGFNRGNGRLMPGVAGRLGDAAGGDSGWPKVAASSSGLGGGETVGQRRFIYLGIDTHD
jgi:hypothetical protein